MKKGGFCMKKFGLLLTSFMFFSLSTINVNANELESPVSEKACSFDSNEKKVVSFKKEQITEIDDLYQMAVENEGYLSKEELNIFTSQEAYLQSNEKSNQSTQSLINNVVELETLSTSELLEAYEVEGIRHEIFAVTEFAVITNEDLKEKEGISTLETDSGEKWDTTISVKAYSTNTYNRTSADGANSCIKLTAVSGGWTKTDSSVGIGTKKVTYGQTGRRCDTTGAVTQSSSPMYPGSTSYSYTVSSSWKPVSLLADVTKVGQVSVTDLTRNSSKWTLSLTNNVTD